MNKSQALTLKAALGVEVMDKDLGSLRGGETMGVGGSPGKQVWPVEGTLRDLAGTSSIFRAVILGSFLFIQRLGMRLNNCQLDIYYRCISLDRGRCDHRTLSLVWSVLENLQGKAEGLYSSKRQSKPTLGLLWEKMRHHPSSRS